tara:strand:+ start:82 stop:678 length:597 start_codon:yes stop_codon:yes gene_type:complete
VHAVEIVGGTLGCLAVRPGGPENVEARLARGATLRVAVVNVGATVAAVWEKRHAVSGVPVRADAVVTAGFISTLSFTYTFMFKPPILGSALVDVGARRRCVCSFVSGFARTGETPNRVPAISVGVAVMFFGVALVNVSAHQVAHSLTVSVKPILASARVPLVVVVLCGGEVLAYRVGVAIPVIDAALVSVLTPGAASY